jgi:hypothetical protein
MVAIDFWDADYNADSWSIGTYLQPGRNAPRINIASAPGPNRNMPLRNSLQNS